MVYYLLVILVSLLPLFSIFSTSLLIHTHDGLVHLPRIAAFFKAFSDGQFPVRWAGDLNYGYGMPLFNFIYQLPYFFSSLFVFLGFGLVNSFKIVLSSSFILSGVFMLMFAKELLGDDKKAFLVTIFYQFAPFRLVELLVRGSFGEVYTYTFLPLLLFGLLRLFKNYSFKNLLLSSFAGFLLIISHNSISLVFFAISVLFVLFFAGGKKNILLGFTSLLLSLGLAAFYFVPAIFEHKFTYGDLFMKNVYLSHFPPFINFFIPNFINIPSFQVQGISVQIGLFHLIAVLLALMFFVFDKKLDSKSRKIFLFSIFLLLFAVFMMQPVSKIFWMKSSILRQFQFPWRFLSVVSFSTSLLAVNFFNFSFLKNKIFLYVLAALVVFSTFYYWRPVLGLDKVKESDYWNYSLNTTYYGETDVVWTGGPASSYPKFAIEVVSGEAEVKNLRKKSQLHTFSVNAKADSVLVDNTVYFPGWRVYVDNKKAPIQFQDQNYRGLITFPIEKGEHDVKVIFQESKIRFVADNISFWTFVFLLLCYFNPPSRNSMIVRLSNAKRLSASTDFILGGSENINSSRVRLKRFKTKKASL